MIGPTSGMDFRKLPTRATHKTSGLRFEHDSVSGQPDDRSPVQRDFDDYAKIPGWTIGRVWDRYNLQKARSSFENELTNCAIIVHRLAAMLRPWLSFGLLEVTTGKMV